MAPIRSFLAALLAAASAASAIQVTFPTQGANWTQIGPNTLSWTSVNTDPANFSIVLVNDDRSILPANNQNLQALVNTSTGTISVSRPASGFPIGGGFRVNIIQDSSSVNSILAQSPPFNIVAGTGNATASQSTSLTAPTLASNAPLTPVASPTSDTSPTIPQPATPNGASRNTAAGAVVALAGAAAAFLA